MQIDLGKDAKRAGALKPSTARKLEPSPPAAKLPAKAKGGKTRKPYGYTYQRRHRLDDRAKWRTVTHYQWYATKRQRDDAMKAAGGLYRSGCEIRNVVPIMRGDR